MCKRPGVWLESKRKCSLCRKEQAMYPPIRPDDPRVYLHLIQDYKDSLHFPGSDNHASTAPATFVMLVAASSLIYQTFQRSQRPT